tara:strand:+ start:90 stop:203 length:114 start_codon:yes stop_codon:yes gene_type:complete
VKIEIIGNAIAGLIAASAFLFAVVVLGRNIGNSNKKE